MNRDILFYLSFLLLSICLNLSTAKSFQGIKKEVYDFDSNENFMVPQIDGTFKLMTEATAKREYLSSKRARSGDFIEIFYYLYTNSKKTGELIKPFNVTSLKNSSFNKKYPTRFITHGWLNNASSTVNTVLREAFLSQGNYNVIIVDWSSVGDTYNYYSARYSVEEVGKQIARFIDFLHKEGGMSFKTLTAIGHSLGAHCVGFAGKNLERGKMNTIIGLDPAWPLFFYNRPDERLAIEDADYVETIQTNGARLGFFDPIGAATFYPNGGKTQPGCGWDWNGQCSHERAYFYYAEAIQDNHFVPMKCETYENHFLNQNCTINANQIKMGDASNPNSANGIYFLETNAEEPYGIP